MIAIFHSKHHQENDRESYENELWTAFKQQIYI